MRIQKRKRLLCFLAWTLAALLIGCETAQSAEPESGTAGSAAKTSAAEASNAETEAVSAEGATGGVLGPVIEANLTFKNKDEYSDYADAVRIDLSNPASASGVSVSGNTITITADGTYVLSGTLADGQIIVNAGDEDDVRLVLENAVIGCSTSAPIYVKNADKVILNLPEGTESSIADTVSGTGGEDTLTGAVYAACDISINGSGTLRITANANDAISTKDDIRMTGGTLEITAADDGLVANDGILIRGGSISITTGGDGVKATKAEADKGYIYIGGGDISIDAGCDGLQAETSILISGGALDIKTGGGSANAETKTGNDMFGGWQNSASDADTPSEKGVKAEVNLEITGGTLTLDTTDDSVHCNGTIVISSGEITARSGNDGLHADNYLEITGGTVTVPQSYEGIEASEIVVSGGEIDVTSTDDGFNAAGGADESSLNGRPGQNGFDGDAGKSMTFEGGTVTVNAGGDGLDSNGSLTINGGTVYVCGPADSANGIFDSGTGFTVNGGVLLGVGSAGMLELPGSDSAQNTVSVNCSGAAGSAVEVRDADGTVLAAYTAPKAFSVVVFSMPEITLDGTYTVYVDGEAAASATCTGVVTGGTAGLGGFGNFDGRMGGGKDFTAGEMPDGEAAEPPEGEMPNGERPGAGRENAPEMPEGASDGTQFGPF